MDSPPECYQPDIVRARDKNLKQGSKSDPVADNSAAQELIETTNQQCLSAYTKLLESGVAPEVARTILPQGMFTEFIETGSLAAYARLCQLRLDPSAQWEIRQYADAVRNLLYERFPVSWKALVPEPETASSESPQNEVSKTH